MIILQFKIIKKWKKCHILKRKKIAHFKKVFQNRVYLCYKNSCHQQNYSKIEFLLYIILGEASGGGPGTHWAKTSLIFFNLAVSKNGFLRISSNIKPFYNTFPILHMHCVIHYSTLYFTSYECIKNFVHGGSAKFTGRFY